MGNLEKLPAMAMERKFYKLRMFDSLVVMDVCLLFFYLYYSYSELRRKL